MTLRGLVGGLGCVVMATTLVAQTPPNLSGVWSVDREKTQAAMAAISTTGPAARMGGGGASGGGSMGGTMGPSSAAAATPLGWTITQTAAAITLVRPLPDGTEQKFVYKLTGESVNTNGRTTLTTKSRWDGTKLVTEGTQVTTNDQGNIAGTFKETRWLDKDGSMHVETARVINGNTPVASVSVLNKKAK